MKEIYTDLEKQAKESLDKINYKEALNKISEHIMLYGDSFVKVYLKEGEPTIELIYPIK